MHDERLQDDGCTRFCQDRVPGEAELLGRILAGGKGLVVGGAPEMGEQALQLFVGDEHADVP